MIKYVRLISCGITLLISLDLRGLEKITYNFSLDPIDIVIPCHKKDLATLEMAIEGIKKNIKHRRLIIVSSEPLTHNAESFNEAQFPFSTHDIAVEILKYPELATAFINHPKSRIGWIYQQFLKLYAPLVIPNISPNVLVIDADTIFLKPVLFQDNSGAPCFNIGTEHYEPYFVHLSKVVPGLGRVFLHKSGICHHMLFQRVVLEDLFSIIEQTHKVETWKAICRCINHHELFRSCMSEYEMYFNFIFSRSNQAIIRPLQWRNIWINNFSKMKNEGYHYLSCHNYMTKRWKSW